MVAKIFHKMKDSTITIGSTQEQSGIISDVTISGGEKNQVSFNAVDDTNYSFAGSPAEVVVEFDYLQAAGMNITEIVYGPETTSGSPVEHTLNWGGDGTEKTITINNVETGGQIFNVVLTNVAGISAEIIGKQGDAVMRHFKGTLSADDVAETVTDRA